MNKGIAIIIACLNSLFYTFMQKNPFIENNMAHGIFDDCVSDILFTPPLLKLNRTGVKGHTHLEVFCPIELCLQFIILKLSLIYSLQSAGNGSSNKDYPTRRLMSYYSCGKMIGGSV